MSFILDFDREEIIKKSPLSEKQLFDKGKAWLLLLIMSHVINIVYLINLVICNTQQFFVLKPIKNSIVKVDVISTCTLWICFLDWSCWFNCHISFLTLPEKKKPTTKLSLQNAQKFWEFFAKVFFELVLKKSLEKCEKSFVTIFLVFFSIKCIIVAI